MTTPSPAYKAHAINHEFKKLADEVDSEDRDHFKRQNHFKYLKDAARGNEQHAHDAATHLLYGHKGKSPLIVDFSGGPLWPKFKLHGYAAVHRVRSGIPHPQPVAKEKEETKEETSVNTTLPSRKMKLRLARVGQVIRYALNEAELPKVTVKSPKGEEQYVLNEVSPYAGKKRSWEVYNPQRADHTAAQREGLSEHKGYTVHQGPDDNLECECGAYRYRPTVIRDDNGTVIGTSCKHCDAVKQHLAEHPQEQLKSEITETPVTETPANVASPSMSAAAPPRAVTKAELFSKRIAEPIRGTRLAYHLLQIAKEVGHKNEKVKNLALRALSGSERYKNGTDVYTELGRALKDHAKTTKEDRAKEFASAYNWDRVADGMELEDFVRDAITKQMTDKTKNDPNKWKKISDYYGLKQGSIPYTVKDTQNLHNSLKDKVGKTVSGNNTKGVDKSHYDQFWKGMRYLAGKISRNIGIKRDRVTDEDIHNVLLRLKDREQEKKNIEELVDKGNNSLRLVHPFLKGTYAPTMTLEEDGKRKTIKINKPYRYKRLQELLIKLSDRSTAWTHWTPVKAKSKVVREGILHNLHNVTSTRPTLTEGGEIRPPQTDDQVDNIGYHRERQVIREGLQRIGFNLHKGGRYADGMVSIGQNLIKKHINALPEDNLTKLYLHNASQISGPVAELNDLHHAAGSAAAILAKYQYHAPLLALAQKAKEHREGYVTANIPAPNGKKEKVKKPVVHGASNDEFMAAIQPALELPKIKLKQKVRKFRGDTAAESPVDTTLPLQTDPSVPSIKPAVEEKPLPLVERTPKEAKAAARKWKKVQKKNILRFSRPAQSNFVDALHRLGSSDQQALTQIAQQIQQSLGLAPSKVAPAIADSANGSSINGVVQTIEHGGDPRKATVAGAWVGHLSNAPAVGVFHVRDDGPDSIYKAKAQGSGENIRSMLNHLGIQHRVLIPKDSGFDVLMVDQGDRLQHQIGQFATANGSGLWQSKGNLEILGSNEGVKSGPEARKSYRNVISQYESGQMNQR